MERRRMKKIEVGSSSESRLINPRRRYRVMIDGKWQEGTFSKQWFGWSFDGGGAKGVQLNLIDQVFEIQPAAPAGSKAAGRRPLK